MFSIARKRALISTTSTNITMPLPTDTIPSAHIIEANATDSHHKSAQKQQMHTQSALEGL